MSVPPEPTQGDHEPGQWPAEAAPTAPLPSPLSGPSPWSRQYAGPAPIYAPPPSLTPPEEQPDWPPASQQAWPSAAQQGWPSDRSRRGLWTGVTLVGIAIVATLIAVLVSTNSGSSKASTSGGSLLPNPAPTVIPTPIPSPAPSTQGPQAPLPSIGGVNTPPGLAAIGYHAYEIGNVDPSDIALGPAELAQFKKYGLSRVVGLRALTLGSQSTSADDWDADINVLQFSSPAAAVAELNYSNSQNKKTATTIPLPGLPNATAFVNKDATTGISIGAFTTVGRYQVVVILSGLGRNVPTDASVVAAEAAKVMRAVLPDAATIVPPAATGGGTGPIVPGLPTPSPTGTHA